MIVECALCFEKKQQQNDIASRPVLHKLKCYSPFSRLLANIHKAIVRNEIGMYILGRFPSPDLDFGWKNPVMRKRGFNGVILVQQKKVVPSDQFWITTWFKTLHLTSLIEVWKFCSIISESEVLHQRHSAREICQFIWRFWILFQVHSLELTLRPWK